MENVELSLYPLWVRSPRGLAFIRDNMDGRTVGLCVSIPEGETWLHMCKRVAIGGAEHLRFVGAIHRAETA